MKINYLFVLLTILFFQHPIQAQDCPPEIGTNLGEFRTALVDIFKSSRSFWETDSDDYIWDTGNPLSLDVNGYPLSINSAEGRAARTLVWEALDGNYPTGTYTLLYDGEGTIELGMDAVNAVFTDNGGTDNRIVFEVNTPTIEGIMVDITSTNSSNHLHNIRIIRPDQAGTDYVNTYGDEPFIDLFYERHKYFQSVRFMDWMTTNWSVYSSWSERPTLQKSSWAIHEAGPGVPVEVMVHVANRLQADPWFCMPHRADDNYMTQFATYVSNNLDSDLKVSIEYSNEVWNGLFSSYDDFHGQHDYALDMGTANGITDYYERIGYWVGRRSGEMFDIFETAFGGNDRLVKVIPIQTGPDLATPHTLDYMHNGTPLHQIGDVVAGAVYFGGEYDRDALNAFTTTELLNHMTTNMYNFDTGPYWCLQTIDMLNNATYQASDLQFVAYEGGQHLANFAGSPSDNATTVLIAANRHPQMGDIYNDFYDWWATINAGTFMTFTSIGEPSMFGAWGLLENIEQDTLDAPKWLATSTWIRENTCLNTALSTIHLDFQGKQNGQHNLLTWRIAAAHSIQDFHIQKFTHQWETIGVQKYTSGQQQFVDTAPTVGENLYRLQWQNAGDAQQFSTVISIDYQTNMTTQLLPNLVNQQAQLQIHRFQNTSSQLTAVATNGRSYLLKNIRLHQGSNQVDVNMQHLPAGVYVLWITDDTGQKESLRFVKT